MRDFTVQELTATMQSHGMVVFEDESRPFNVNCVAVRNQHDPRENAFDDAYYVFYMQEGEWVKHRYTVTTDPGTHWKVRPMHRDGAAAIAEGQYRGAYQLGYHGRGNWRHRALVQAGMVSAYRDNNKDAKYDYVPATITTYGAWAGLNQHKAFLNQKALRVDKWSAGCIVWEDPNAHTHFINLLESAARQWGNSFTLTMLNSRMIERAAA